MHPLYQFDESLFRSIHVDFRRDWLDFPMRMITDTGLFHITGIIFLLILLVRYFVGEEFLVLRQATGNKLKLFFQGIWKVGARFELAALLSGAIAGLLTQLIKRFVSRDRPSNFEYAESLQMWTFDAHPFPTGDNSFPSGHATSSFGVAVFLAWCLRGTEYALFGWVAILWAALVAFSRVYVGVHFVSDVVAGAAMGAIFATLFYQFCSRKGWVVRRADPID